MTLMQCLMFIFNYSAEEPLFAVILYLVLSRLAFGEYALTIIVFNYLIIRTRHKLCSDMCIHSSILTSLTS